MSMSPTTAPQSAHDRELLRNVRPADWQNPTPPHRYNLVVLGAGSAGLVTAAIAAGLGARVALVERHLLGGDCLVTGCVPSKGVIRAARMVAEARRAEKEVGLPLKQGGEADFALAMERMRRLRARISEEDSAERFRKLGVDVYLGEARFTARDAVEVGGAVLRFRKAVIATGARAAALPIEGLAEAGYLTNETVFDLTQRPRRLGIIGAGPIGCEMAQAFRRLGSEVVVLHADAHLLPREDPDAATIVARRFREEGIRVEDGVRIERVSRQGPEKRIHVARAEGRAEEVPVDEILLAVGRAPNVEGLDLEKAGVAYDGRRGVHVDDHLRTTNKRIFAAGDICMAEKFTHAADAAAKIAVQNALFLPTQRVSKLVMPWCTYTDPEVAHVGLYAREAEAAGVEIDTFHVPLEQVNRAVTDGEADGFAKVHVKKGTDTIVGGTVVSAHAGEMISELTVAIVNGVGLSGIGQAIHPYPTQAEALKRAAGLYTRTRLSPRLATWLRRYMAWRR